MYIGKYNFRLFHYLDTYNKTVKCEIDKGMYVLGLYKKARYLHEDRDSDSVIEF